MIKIDPRLVAIYNEYLKKDKEEEFIWMLLLILDLATVDVVEKIKRKHRYWKMKETRDQNKSHRKVVEEYFRKMSPDERIEFLNKPYEEQSEWVKENIPDLVKYPEEFNFLRIAGEVPKEEYQKERFGARLIRYMEKSRFLTSDENGTKLDLERFCEVCNELAMKYDLARRKGHRAQRTRITPLDLKGYTQKNVTPKKDKLTTIAVAMDVPVAYLGGYGDNDPPPPPPPGGSVGPIGGKFRKKRK